MKYPPVQYHDYLGLSEILNSQKRRSEELGKPAHDEMLFMIVHQTYELWFRQMLFEIDSVQNIFAQEKMADTEIATAVARLERVVEIQKYINGQIDILETMTPLDFLEFRDMLYPASGFQSFQWRCLETRLGLPTDQRLQFNQSPFYQYLKPEQQKSMIEILQKPSLFDQVEKWLERTPFLQTDKFNFWQGYKDSVYKLFAEDEKVVRDNPKLSPAEVEKNIEQIKKSLEMFESLFSNENFENLKEKKYFRLSLKAVQASLLIQLYRQEPILQMPHRLLQALVNLDEHMTQWRYRHALMAHRMLGRKIGTGGSSGHDYLKSATEQHKIFSDFFNLTTFLIPRSMIPTLPEEIKNKMRFSDCL